MVKVKIPTRNEIDKVTLAAMRKGLEAKLARVSCPDHHRPPQVTVSGTLRNPRISVEGCCQKLIDLTNETLK